ncbi:MAG TPA: LamG domain-containing protein [Polyangia bacterium]|nr:LamG domain-containing protein [Polyangia bacterium]
MRVVVLAFVLAGCAVDRPLPGVGTGVVVQAGDLATAPFDLATAPFDLSLPPGAAPDLTTPPSACGQLAADAHTLALYHFDEAAGQTLADSSGNGRDATLGQTSAVEPEDPTHAPGRLGGGLHFDGNQVAHASASIAWPSGQFTAEAWVRYLGSDEGPFGTAMIFDADDGELAAQGTCILWTLGAQGRMGGPPAFSDGQWHSIALTSDGAQVLVYSDGVQVDATQVATTIGPSAGYLFGGQLSLAHLIGDLDEIRLSDVARTPSEIAAAYAAALACP